MGKLGGGELNFSSDVDLVYVYEHDDKNGADYYRRLAQRITTGLNDFTGEGYVYRVDLRLRPEGEAGEIAGSLDSYKRYYETRLGTWERLALLKAWPVAGNRAVGAAFLQMAQSFIYGPSLDSTAVADILEMKRRSDDRMAIRDQRSRNVKLGTGGIREVELIAQSLQVRNGESIPEVRGRGTVQALATLCEHSLISREERESLTQAYIFLRDVENKLQMVNDAQTHSLPRDHEELTTCARLLGYSGAEQFLVAYQHHTGWVNRIFQEKFGVLNAG
jgi:glutamate-ammonia-ligase adenylyltransferase